MDINPARDRLDGIVELVARLGTATAAQIEEGMELKRRLTGIYIAYLCSIGRLALHQKHNSAANVRATYKLGVLADVPVPRADEFDVRRRVGANDWPRGEHAHRSGLLAVFYPFARG